MQIRFLVWATWQRKSIVQRWDMSEWVKIVQSCPTLCDPMNHSSPGSSVHGILHTRILEWVDMPSSRRAYRPRDQTLVLCTIGRCFTIWASCKTQWDLIWWQILAIESQHWAAWASGESNDPIVVVLTFSWFNSFLQQCKVIIIQ